MTTNQGFNIRTDYRDQSIRLMAEINDKLEFGISKDSDFIRLSMRIVTFYLKESGADIDKCNTCDLYTWTQDHDDDNEFWQAVCHKAGMCPSAPIVDVPAICVPMLPIPDSPTVESSQFDASRLLREHAKELMYELNEEIRSRNISKDSETARMMMDLITTYLRQGGVGIEKCATCDIHEWKKIQNNEFWKFVCHDPGKCSFIP